MTYTQSIDYHPDTIIIRPCPGWAPLRLYEIWRYHELIYFLVWRDLKVRYSQTVIGAAWVLIQPTLTTLIFTVFFGRLAKLPSDGTPYAVFALCGIVPWQLFANSVSEAGNSLISNQGLIKKVYFPRLILPLARVLAGLVDFCIAFLLLLVVTVAYRIMIRPAALALPGFVLLALATAVGAGLWLSALTVRYRDIHHAVTLIMQLWLFATPVAYPSSMVPGRFRVLYGLNPMAGIIEGFRWALLGSSVFWPMIAVSAIMGMLLLASGLFYFKRVERTFADVL